MADWRQLLDYTSWANRRALESLKSVPVSDGACRILAHIAAAERLWLYRMDGRDTSELPVWADWAPDHCASVLEENHRLYAAFLERLGASGLERIVTYRNTAGKTFQTAIRDIIWHVFLHGAYHRGQIARLVREAGGEPLPTDYVVYVREGFQREPGVDC